MQKHAIFLKIKSYPKRIKLGCIGQIYDNPIETSINNSPITNFYLKYHFLSKYDTKRLKTIPFPYEKITSKQIECLDKLNKIAKIYENDISGAKYICFNIMNIILFELYFDIKSEKFDIYSEIDKIEIPDEKNKRKFERFLLNGKNSLNTVIFYSLTDSLSYTIYNY